MILPVPIGISLQIVVVLSGRAVSRDVRRPAKFIQNKRGEYIIPGSSLKGMLRSVVETLGNGCFTLFDGNYEPIYRDGRVRGYDAEYKRLIPDGFQKCQTNTQLCISCRIFGMLKEGARGVYLGKINIGDATVYAGQIEEYKPIYTGVLVNPKPHHQDFYLDESQQHIAGRKYYFHHSPDVEPIQENKLVYFGENILANRYIQPLNKGTTFHFRIDFTNLEADEFAALLLAIRLEDGMRHKIGYAKPLGLGSIQLIPTKLTLVDYAKRYTQPRAKRGMTPYEASSLEDLFNQQIISFSRTNLVRIAMDDLRRIWRWPPDRDVEYYYPSKRDWFDTPDSIGKRIADTRKTP